MNNNENPNTNNNSNINNQNSIPNNFPINNGQINNVAKVIPIAKEQVVNTQPKAPQAENIVAPTMVDLSKVQVNNDDTMINRERDNIVSATIQANEAIDKKKAKDVNNQIKVKKFSKLHLGIIVGVVIVLIIGVSIVVVSGANKIMTYDEEKNNTTTTTESAYQKELSYLTKMDTIRKYQNEEYILILSPNNIDKVDNKTYYMYLKYNQDGVLEEENGTYTINDNKLILTSKANNNREFTLETSGLVADTITLTKTVSETKYYQYKSSTSTKILIINATFKAERALWIKSDASGTTYQSDICTESQTDIKMGVETFSKKGMNIVHNNEEYIIGD